MTEAEWMECTDPTAMFKALYTTTGEPIKIIFRSSERKLRMFAVACCRRIWHLLPDTWSRQAVEVAERYADALATEEELETAAAAACSVWDTDVERASTEGQWNRESRSLLYTAAAAAYNVAIPLGWWGAAPAFVAPDEIAREISAQSGAECAAQCVLLRDIFGNPFHAITMTPRWRTSTTVAIAHVIYEDRRFQDLPILADALEDAGCDNVDILTHCRGGGEHVRGCWVVDLLLGKS
jgi:hypothetical protein